MKRERSHELSPDRMEAEDDREGRKNSFFLSLYLSFFSCETCQGSFDSRWNATELCDGERASRKAFFSPLPSSPRDTDTQMVVVGSFLLRLHFSIRSLFLRSLFIFRLSIKTVILFGWTQAAKRKEKGLIFFQSLCCHSSSGSSINTVCIILSFSLGCSFA